MSVPAPRGRGEGASHLPVLRKDGEAGVPSVNADASMFACGPCPFPGALGSVEVTPASLSVERGTEDATENANKTITKYMWCLSLFGSLLCRVFGEVNKSL